MTPPDSPAHPSSVHYYTAAAVRELDRIAIEKHGIPGFELMQRAGRAAFRVLLQHWPETRHLLVICGTGNNGGDGFIVAGLAAEAGMSAEVYLAGETDSIQSDARKAMDFALQRQVPILPAIELYPLSSASPAFSSPKTVIIDALLGTGLSGQVRTPTRQLITQVNASGLPVLALDIPSGLCSDTGKVLGEAIRADVTVTFIGRKVGQVRDKGPGLCGQLVFDNLGVPSTVYAQVNPLESSTLND